MVHTSTINVVFAGKPIEDGDEASVPHVPSDLVSGSQIKIIVVHLLIMKCMSDVFLLYSTSTTTPELKRLQSRWSSQPTDLP